MPAETVATNLELTSVGCYDLLSKIAVGGMGTVWKGRHRITGAIVAIKVVPPHLLSNQVFLKRFEQEYSAARELDHPNIVKALDFGREGNVPYLVMEYVEGESLGQRLDRVHHLSEKEAIDIICQVAEGLFKAHQKGLIHRDVKPDNILITKEGIAKLTDLGLVKELDTDLNLTRTGRGLGTPHYMAQEQFRNAKKADVRCDIYSLAATLYHMVTGELPFKSLSPLDAWMKKLHNELPAPRQLMPSLSDRVDWAIRRSMDSDPAKRAASCREFIEDLTGRGTRKMAAPSASGIAPVDVWYMYYKDEDDVIHTVKGSTEGIRKSLRRGLLGDGSNVKVARSKTGPFEPLRSRPEFRDLLLDTVNCSHQDTAKLASSAPMRTPAPQTRTFPSEAVPPLHSRLGDSGILASTVPECSSTTATPNIVLERSEPTPDWLRWSVLVLFASVTGVALFFVWPKIYYLRLFW
ncbi:MAG: serine/threonine protein kinase [Gemmataceae bacterium]|nr:serine/threonine protein kinase [Gemmataceae bacterium]